MGDGAYGSAYKVLRGKALPGGGFILSRDDETGTPADGASAGEELYPRTVGNAAF